ncbi:MAG: hypothetical protein ACTID1_01870 [Pseudolactococcus laudensis]
MFFVTKMDDDVSLGSTLINAEQKHNYFETVKKELSREFGDKQITFVKLSELYEQLGSNDSTETILLSKYAKPYQKSLSNKYPLPKS